MLFQGMEMESYESDIISLASQLEKLMKVINHSDPSAKELKHQLHRKYQQNVAAVADQIKGRFQWDEIKKSIHALFKDEILDIDDGIEYGIGKGPTSTTVTAADVAIPVGSHAVIKGTVMDQSPGKPNVPAVADEDMSEWMDYLYGQNATLLNNPPTPTGVPVRIQIVDPTGAYSWIGTATTDSNGNYGYSFAPQKEGTYQIIATFDGSDSYFGSQQSTYLVAGPAASPGGSITPETPEIPLITTEIALVLVAAIAAIVLVAFLALRRRK